MDSGQSEDEHRREELRTPDRAGLSGYGVFSAVQRNHKGNDLFFPFPFISSHERMFHSRILLSYSPNFCEKICVFKKNQKDDQNTEW